MFCAPSVFDWRPNRPVLQAAVDPKILKRLKIKDLLAPFAISRGLSNAQLSDLVARATEDKRFDLSAFSDEFADYYMDGVQARAWAEELEQSGRAGHLFSVSPPPANASKTFGGFTEAELAQMPPKQRLGIAKQLEFDRA